uniref:Uncharacterized protein n=1 Tax=viral metagenome TaxID=1070528 RepID=A0A6C0BVF8_9ZZZZ
MSLYSKIINGKPPNSIIDLSNMLTQIKELLSRDDYEGFFNLFYQKAKPGYGRPDSVSPFDMTEDIRGIIDENIRDRGDKLLKKGGHGLYYFQYIKELFLRIIKIRQDILKINILKALNGGGMDLDKLKRIGSEQYFYYERIRSLNRDIIDIMNQGEVSYFLNGVIAELDEEEFGVNLEREYIRVIDEYDTLINGDRLRELSKRINLEVSGDEILYEKEMNQESMKQRKINREKLDDIYKKIIEENKPEDIFNNAMKEYMLINQGIKPSDAHNKIFTITEDELVSLGFTPEEVEFFMPKKTTKKREPQLSPLSSTSSYMTAPELTEDEEFYDASSEYIGGKQRRKKKSNKKSKKKQQKKRQKRRNTRKN